MLNDRSPQVLGRSSEHTEMFGTIGRMDPLAEVLEIRRVRGAVLAHVVAHDPWGMRLSSTPGAAFHAIAAGTCWLRVDGQPPRRLMPGDVVLLPTGIEHDLVSDPGGAARAYHQVAKD